MPGMSPVSSLPPPSPHLRFLLLSIFFLSPVSLTCLSLFLSPFLILLTPVFTLFSLLTFSFVYSFLSPFLYFLSSSLFFSLISRPSPGKLRRLQGWWSVAADWLSVQLFSAVLEKDFYSSRVNGNLDELAFSPCFFPLLLFHSFFLMLLFLFLLLLFAYFCFYSSHPVTFVFPLLILLILFYSSHTYSYFSFTPLIPTLTFVLLFSYSSFCFYHSHTLVFTLFHALNSHYFLSFS